MAKANFERVENALQQEMQKRYVQGLLQEADTLSKSTTESDSTTKRRMSAAEQAQRQLTERRSLIAGMKFDIDRLFRQERHLYTILKTNNEEVLRLFESVDTLGEADTKRLLEIAEALKAYKARCNELDDGALVEQKRRLHVNKRFNVNEKWLPLR